MVAAAVVGGAVVGGIATTMAGNKAADAQEAAANTASGTQLKMYNQNRADLAPYRQAGYTALNELGTETAPGGDLNRDFTLADFNADPGYQFRMDQGQQALERSASARGGLLSGGAGKALERYGQDYASNEYSSAYSRFNNDRTTRFNRLSALSGIGQQATNTTTQQGASTANSIAENTLGAGNVQAANAVNTGNAVSGAASSLGSFYLQQQYLNKIPNAGSSSGNGSYYGYNT